MYAAGERRRGDGGQDGVDEEMVGQEEEGDEEMLRNDELETDEHETGRLSQKTIRSSFESRESGGSSQRARRKCHSKESKPLKYFSVINDNHYWLLMSFMQIKSIEAPNSNSKVFIKILGPFSSK